MILHTNENVSAYRRLEIPTFRPNNAYRVIRETCNTKQAVVTTPNGFGNAAAQVHTYVDVTGWRACWYNDFHA